jgi:hypothetical protein
LRHLEIEAHRLLGRNRDAPLLIQLSPHIADSDATEDLADNTAAMESAKLIAKDLARSKPHKTI